MNAQETAKLLAYIRITEPRQELDEATVFAWQERLSDVDFAVAREAVVLHDRESAAWVKPAHIRQQAERILAAGVPGRTDEFGNDVEPDPAALAAWRRVHQQKEVTR